MASARGVAREAGWNSGKARAGDRGGARPGKPRGVRMATITAGSSNRGEDLQCAAAMRAVRKVELEHAREQARPSHRCSERSAPCARARPRAQRSGAGGHLQGASAGSASMAARVRTPCSSMRAPRRVNHEVADDLGQQGVQFLHRGRTRFSETPARPRSSDRPHRAEGRGGPFPSHLGQCR
jgi:hypothetical protein